MQTVISYTGDYTAYCRKLYKRAWGCLINGKPAMRLWFSARALKPAYLGSIVVFAADQWEVTVNIRGGKITIKAPNTDVAATLMPD